MPTVQERVAALEGRVDKMDMELKEHFAEQRLFISGALTGLEERLEKRLGSCIDSLGVRFDKLDRNVRAAFAGMDAKLIILIERGARRTQVRPRRRR